MYNAERVKPYLDKLPGFKNYQLEGVLFVDDQDGRALIADEMGLGKTLTSIAVIWTFVKVVGCKAVVACPSSLVDNWEKEVSN